MPIDEVLINNTQYSWTSLRIKFADGDEFTGITKIDYSDKLEVSTSTGTGKSGRPKARTAGKYSTDPVTMTVFKKTARAIRKKLASQSANGKSYGTVQFGIIVQYIEDDEEPVTEELLECRLVSNKASAEENPDPLKEDLELHTMRILRDGLSLYDSRDEGQ